MRVVVTGASGFIGRRFCRLLKEKGCHVVGLDVNPASGDCDEAFVGDLTVEGPWFKALEGADTVIHLAGKAHALAEVAQDETEYFRINTEGTRRMLEAAKRAGVRSFVLFSTVKAVGDRPNGPDTGPVDENWDAEPDTPYGRSKREAEKLVLEGGYVPHPVVLRFCLVYGPSPKGNLSKMIDAVRRGRFPPLPEVSNRRSMVHIDDAIAAAILAAERPEAVGQTFIVADNEPFSTRQLYEWISNAVGRPVPRWTVPLCVLRALGKTGDVIGRVRGRRFVFDSDAFEKLVSSAWYSSAKIQRELGWKPAHTLRESMPEIVASTIGNSTVGSASRR